jgi:hypothetical protein
LFYEENGDALLSTATTERVIAIIRANYGLHSLEQVPSVLRLARNAEARGDFQTVWNLEQRLLSLAERHPDNLNSVPIWRHFGDLRMDMLERYAAGELPPRMRFGCYHDNVTRLSGCIAGSRSDAARGVLSEAHDYYRNAIDVLLRNDQYAGDEVRQLEMALAVSSFRYGRFFEGTAGCDRGLESLTRLHEYANRDPAAVEDRVNSLLQIADGMLVCRQNALALKVYEQAWELAHQEGLAPAAIESMFAPDKPIAVPSFMPGPLVAADAQGDDQSVEVEFELTRYGLTRDVDVLERKKPGVTGTVRRLIKGQRFRPFISDGEVRGSPRYVVRYSLDQQVH